MKQAVAMACMAGVVVLFLAGALAGNYNAPGQPPAQASTGLIVLSSPVGETVEQLIVVDPVTRAVGVYHVEKTTGKVTLKSVRRIEWDLQMNAFNTAEPQPLDIRNLVNPK